MRINIYLWETNRQSIFIATEYPTHIYFSPYFWPIMLERYLSHMLTNKFGHIFENLDDDKIRVSAWNGEVVLEDLNLKQNSLDTLLSDTPLEIRYGHIGKLEVKIPWKVLRSRAKDVNCSLVLSDVCILISPKRSSGTKTETNELEPSLVEKRTAKEEKVQADRKSVV